MFANWFASGGAQWLLTVGGIIVVDIALSGDNAVVIGAAASHLAGRQRSIALAWGCLGAIVIRIALTGVATELLLIPLLQSVGGVVILFIALRMLAPEKEDDGSRRRASDHLWTAILSILVADVTMSLDNVLAVGALAHGNLPLLVFGLVVSMALLLLASALVARLITRFWWLMDLSALILAYLAAQLVIEDPIVSQFAGLAGWRATALTVGALVVVGVVALTLRIRQRRARLRQAATAHAAAEETPEADRAAS
ncbi:MAG: YjbE family putative metal transport protein [Ktedonobacterales bacterium]